MPYPVIPNVPAASISPYANGAVPLVKSSGNQANATATATLTAPTNGQTMYITGFDITGSGATVASVVQATVTDGTWTVTFEIAVVAGVTAQNTPLIVRFPEPVPASASNTGITVSCPALGSGNTNCCVNAYGFQL